jgi:hypothetical protein
LKKDNTINIFILCCLFLFFINLVFFNSDLAILIQVVTYILLFYYQIRFNKKNTFLINPLNWYLTLYFIYYCSGSLFSVYFEDGNSLGVSVYYFKLALLYIIICSVLFLIGFNTYNTKKKFHFYLSETKTPYFLILSFILYVISKIYAVYNGRYFHAFGDTSLDVSYGSFEQIFYFFGLLNIFIIIILGFYGFDKKNKKYKLLFYAATIFFVFVELFSGSKERVMLPLFISILIYNIYSNKVPIYFLLFSLFAFLFIIFPFYEIYRLSSSLGVVDSFILSFKSIFLFTNDDFLESATRVNSTRLNAASIQARIIQEHNIGNINYKLGTDYIELFENLIPRFIWSDKPVLSNANVFGVEYGVISEYDINTSIAQYWQGEAFINFGWFGCFIGFLLGRLMGFIRKYFYSKNNLMGIFFFVLFSYFFLRIDQFAHFFVGSLKAFVFYILIFIPFIKKIHIKGG